MLFGLLVKGQKAKVLTRVLPCLGVLFHWTMDGREKVVWLLIDGLGDVTLPVFGDRTPLEVAHVPWLDSIAGAAGLVRCFSVIP